MTRVAVIAHFLSANLGDRYQGTGLVERLVSAIPGIVVDRVNSHSFDCDIEVQTVKDATPVPFDVLNPDKVDISSYDFAIMSPGSIASDSVFVERGLKLLESQRLKRLFVWGGFHDITDFVDIYDPDERLKRLFCDSRSSFFARGWLELAVYHMLAGAGRGGLGGDPVLLNDFSPFRSLSPPCEKKETLVISGHLFTSLSDRDLNNLSEIVSLFFRVCYIEGPEDRTIINQIGEEKFSHVRTIAEYATIARSSSIIVTQRLHGLSIAKAVSPGLPVILWVPRRERFSHIKFRSVAESATGFGLGIAHLWENFSVDDARSVVKNPDSFMRREHEINFAHYMELTERTLRTIVMQIAEGKGA